MSPTYRLDKPAALWRRYGRPSIPALGGNDGFVYGVTFPTPENTGALQGSPREVWTGAYDIYGSSDPENPTTFLSKIFTRPVKVREGHVRFWDCEFTNLDLVVPTSEEALLTCFYAAVGSVTVERCSFDPGEGGAHWFLNAITGHHLRVRRCFGRRVVDFVGTFNTHATVTDSIIEGNMLESLAYFVGEYGVIHPSDTRTHNDGIQHQGGQGIIVRGNRLHGLRLHPDGTPPTDQGTNWEHYADNGVLISGAVQAGTPVSTPEYPAIVDRNWIYGFNQPFPFKTLNGGTGGAGAFDVTLTGNRLDDQRRYQGPSPVDYYGVPGGRPYTVRTGTETTVNGDATVPADGAERPLTSGDNRYFENPSLTLAEARRGQFITIRRDPFAGSHS